jgi:hypothetical protein
VDITGKYAYSYYIGGIGMCLTASILLAIFIRNKCKNIEGVVEAEREEDKKSEQA